KKYIEGHYNLMTSSDGKTREGNVPTWGGPMGGLPLPGNAAPSRDARSLSAPPSPAAARCLKHGLIYAVSAVQRCSLHVPCDSPSPNGSWPRSRRTALPDGAAFY